MTAPTENPAELDRQDPDAEIGARAEAFRNWGRWGQDDVLGTLDENAGTIEGWAVQLEPEQIAVQHD